MSTDTTTKPAGVDLKHLIDCVQVLAGDGVFSRDVAGAIEQILRLKDDEAMLACRLLGGGADPASLSYLRTGRVPAMVTLAHRQGPSVFSPGHPERDDYLVLCEVSEDEAKDSTLRSRMLKFASAMNTLDQIAGAPIQHKAAARRVEREILALKFATIRFDKDVRLYTSDLGHAAGAWDQKDPQTMTAVFGWFNGEPYVSLAAPHYHPTLEEQGCEPELATKLISPRFWIYEDGDQDDGVVSGAARALRRAGLLTETR